MSQPTGVALLCQSLSGGQWQGTNIADCEASSASTRLLAVISNGPTGDLTLMNLDSGKAVDLSKTIPGFTRMYLGGYLADVVGHPDGMYAYVLDTVGSQVYVVDPQEGEVDAFALPYPATTLTLGDGGESLMMTFPDRGRLGVLSLDADGLPKTFDEVTIGGSPTHIVSTGGKLVAAHMDKAYISVLDPVSLDEINRIGIVRACQDGLDNDGDGLTDREDPGCSTFLDDDETDVAATDLPLCSDGIDNDSDGLSDMEDPGCRNRADWTEKTDELGLDQDAMSPLPCADGIDNDGDGLVDYPDDPGCFAAGAGTEREVPDPAARVAVSPTGKWAYVAHQGLSTVMVIDLENGIRIDVNSLDDSLGRRLRADNGIYGIQFGYIPTHIVFQQREELLYAYIHDLGGRSTRVLVEDEDGPVHLTDSTNDEDDVTIAKKPRLYSDGAEIQLGYTPIAGYSSMGALLVETIDDQSDAQSYYGIRFGDDLRAQRNETWTVAFEGVIPGTGDFRGRLSKDGLVTVLGGDLCSSGVLPGDSFVVAYDSLEECGIFVNETSYSYEILEVGSDWIELDPESGIGRKDGDTSDAPVPDPACFPDLVDFNIRVADCFIVKGSTSGFLNNVVATTDGCREDPDGDPLFTGRAYAATLKKGEPLSQCPVLGVLPELELQPFVNSLLSFDLFPACQEGEDGINSLVDSEQGTVWQFSVVSGFIGQTIIAARLPSDQVFAPDGARLFVLDLAGRALRAIGLDEFELVASFY
jgi:hypothetical protein